MDYFDRLALIGMDYRQLAGIIERDPSWAYRLMRKEWPARLRDAIRIEQATNGAIRAWELMGLPKGEPPNLPQEPASTVHNPSPQEAAS